MLQPTVCIFFFVTTCLRYRQSPRISHLFFVSLQLNFFFTYCTEPLNSHSSISEFEIALMPYQVIC